MIKKRTYQQFSASASVLIFLLVCCFFSISVKADNGWDFIRHNDDIKARAAFKTVLKTDSLNLDALEGMIYLSDIEQDNLSYAKYANCLIRNFHNEYFYRLFENVYEGTDAFIANQKNFSEETKIQSQLDLAESLKEKRQFKASHAAYQKLIKDYHWNLIGPFKDISGSGLILPFKVEKDSFSSAHTYKNYNELLLKWVKPKYVSNDGIIDFNDYLPGGRHQATYYANTFISVPRDETVQFRLTRQSPMKIWVDDNLVFEDKDAITFSRDNEFVQLKLKAGKHRILVKLAVAGSKPKSYGFLSFNDGNDDDLGTYADASRYIHPNVSFYLSGLFNSQNTYSKSFGLRITDTAGTLIQDIVPVDSTGYQRQQYITKEKGQFVIQYFKTAVSKHPDQLFNYYALSKAYINAGLTKNAEEFFVKALRTNDSLVFFKYLAAKMYALNGKIAASYETLNDINQSKTPVFGLLYDKFKSIDINNDEKKYLAALKQLKGITPSNYSVIRGYINYYDQKGMQKEKLSYINKMKKKYPVYDDSLDYELSLSDNKPYQAQTASQQRRQAHDAIHRMKTRFFPSDYSTAIDFYKSKNRHNKVLATYNDLLEHDPYDVTTREDKASYLYSRDQYDEALKVLHSALEIAPYDTRAIEQMGDIYNDMDTSNTKNQQKALYYYRLAKSYGGGSYNIDDKISNIAGQTSYKNLFDSKTYDDILKDKRWKKMYPNDDAIVLLYTTDISRDTNAHMEAYQQLMIKILTQAGANNWTQYDFSFLGNITMAKVIKKNGAEVIPDQNGGYIVFKNLEPGDIIEINGSYKWDQHTALGRNFAFSHYVSFSSPVYYKDYQIAIPHGEYLGYMYHNLKDNLSKTTKDGYDIYEWKYYNLPKIENEQATVDNYDLYSNIMVSTIHDWSTIVKWFQQITYRKLDMTYEVKEALDTIVKPNMNDSEKIVAIYNYITKQIKYSYVSFLQSGYVPKDPGLTLSSRIGDCKDVATLMITMLRAIGVESYYTLVKTNSYNHEKLLPSLNFDHVIVCYYLKGKQHFLDLTTNFYPSYVLTENDINAWALLIKPGVKNVFQLPDDQLDPSKNKVVYTVNAQINDNSSVNMNVKATYPGMAGGNIRETMSNISQLEKKNFILGMLGKGVFQNLNLNSDHFANLDQITNPLKANYSLTAPDFCDNVANLLICRIPYMTGITSSDAISSKTRQNRLDVTAICRVEPTLQKVTIHFPEGYHLIQVPKDISLSSKYGTYHVTFKKIKNGLYIEKYQQFNKDIIPVDEFNAFKAYYLKLLGLDKMKIAIQKQNA